MNTNLVKETTEAALERIERHPFIIKSHLTLLTREESLRWVKCAGRESRTFPEILENMIPRCTNDLVKEILEENLADEHGNGNPEHAHFNHYLHLLDKLGIPRDEFEGYQEGPGIKLALSLARAISLQPSPAVSLGYMLVNEGMTPITYEAARSSLTHHFPDLSTTFFDLHIEVDVHHVAELYRAVAMTNESDLDDILFGIGIGERGMAVLLDEALGVFDHDKSVCSKECRCNKGSIAGKNERVA